MHRWILAIVALGVVGCGNKDGGATVPPTGSGTATAATGTGTGNYTTAEFGLDERPANLSCTAPDRPLTAFNADLVRVFTNLTFSSPVWIGQVPSVPGYWYVVEKSGRLLRFVDDPNTSSYEVVMDIQNQVLTSSEEGMLSVAFHPDFASNGRVFVYFTSDPNGGFANSAQLWRAQSNDGGATLALDTMLIEVDEPFWNHNGGALAFGPDGYLYWGLGDGGSGGDPGNRAQNTDEWLGKIHRIDVDSGNPYGIPADNPFAQGGGRPEIYAYGVRNPWRFSFDSVTGALWLGDVGQNSREEVDQIQRGGNYGWRIMEGNDCYNPANCSDAGLIRPYIDYNNPGGASVIGGVVYYGSDIPELNGIFLYSDIGAGNVNGVFTDEITGLPVAQQVVSQGRSLSHFATGADGEVYACDHSNGRIYNLQRVGAGAADPFPQLLSQTGCMDPSDVTQPGPALIPYTVAHSFWSDDADKERFMAIPDGTTVTIGADGDWEFPIGTVLIKHLEPAGVRVETRLMVRHDDGEWAGYAYGWNAAGTDADLLTGGLLVDDLPGGASWSVPSRGECLRCHTPAAAGSLGPETRQMNVQGAYPSTGRLSNQIATLDHIGWFAAAAPDPTTLPVFPAREDTSVSDEEMARTWLHVNCSQCHRPGGPSRGNIDFRYDTALADMAACDIAPNHGDLGLGGGARVIVPGDAASSVLVSRISRRDAYQMPPLATKIVDPIGVAAVTAWIDGLASCP